MERKLEKYQEQKLELEAVYKGDEQERRAKRNHIEKQIRKYERELWAVIGMEDHNYEFKCVLVVYDRFVHLDLVPTHYNYPEFYRF